MGNAGLHIRPSLESIADESPSPLVEPRHRHVASTAFQIELVLSEKGTNITVCDIGGGTGFFCLGCARLGMKAILLDDFGDEVIRRVGDGVFAQLNDNGVQVIRRDAVEDGLDFAPDSIDVFTCFGTVEHFHHSPKRLLAQVMTALAPGGLFLLSAPNCVNMRKRITVPLGRGSWSPMAAWYDAQQFRSHVREPSVSDLRYIAKDMGLSNVRILGRNWDGLLSPKRLIRAATRLSDRILRLRPTLCGVIYLAGTKGPQEG